LQRSLLPGTSPQIAGLDLAVRYLPASDGVHVGGDWYDAFPLRDGRVGLVIGDIAGHDLAAAAVMGQVRSLLRAYALDEPDPSEVLRRTGDAVNCLLPDVLASAVYAVLDPATGELRYANAGHPPPLLTARAGECGYLDDAPGVMLGAPEPAPQSAGRCLLPRGAALLLYTDGLIEDCDRDISVGLGTLASALRGRFARTASEVCDAAQGLMCTSSALADDVCLLAVRLLA
jgi:serine/threonine-protein kinase RsbW